METVGAGARKSGCFLDQLRQGLAVMDYSDLDGHTLVSGHAQGRRSALTLIAMAAETAEIGDNVPRVFLTSGDTSG